MFRRARFRSRSFALGICWCAASLIGTAAGQQTTQISKEDLDALLKRMEANRRANDLFAKRYTYDRTTRSTVYGRNGRVLSDHTSKTVTVAVDGIEYDRLVEVDGKPLSIKKQIAEQQRSDMVGKLGKDYDFVYDMVRGDPRKNVYSDLPVSYLDSLFDNQIIGHELVNGRDNLVVESTPKADAKPQSDREKTALDWKETTWIDVEDVMPTRYTIKLINGKHYLMKGSTSSIEFTRWPVTRSTNLQSPRYVWLIHGLTGSSLYSPKCSESLSEDYYNYKRFQSDAHVLEDSVREVPAPASDWQP